MAMSDLEERVFSAEMRLGWKPSQVALQVPIRGGRNVKGGLIVDQVVYRPHPLPVFINGDYWHRDAGQEVLERAAVWQEFGALPVVIWGHEIPNEEQTLAVVLERIGRP